VGEQHRSLTEDLDRALIEPLTKRILDGDQLAERLQRGGKVAPTGVRQRGNRLADRLGADPEGFDHPGRGRSRSANTSSSDLASPGTRAGGSPRGASQRSAQPGTVRRASTCRYQPWTTPSSPV